MGVGTISLSLQALVRLLSACSHRSNPRPLHLYYLLLVQVCSSGFWVFTWKLGTYSHRAPAHPLHPHAYWLTACHVLIAISLTLVRYEVGTHFFLFAPSSTPVRMGLLLHWTSWFFNGLPCVENGVHRFSAPCNSRVVIAPALDPIFCENRPAIGSGPLAIRWSTFDNVSGGFRSWTGSGPPATCCRASAILLREYDFEPLRECVLTTLEWLSWALLLAPNCCRNV